MNKIKDKDAALIKCEKDVANNEKKIKDLNQCKKNSDSLK